MPANVFSVVRTVTGRVTRAKVGMDTNGEKQLVIALESDAGPGHVQTLAMVIVPAEQIKQLAEALRALGGSE